ncbi:response regulator transcription factor [Hymenobacter busanensis]|uniref:Response regulator transcription factor n=1 Tax=Hymenobacter busanensis TaxID=2607656 RepID=A0A7L4ZRX8_9BACT|nr:response regulator transcription factor [Hymenobacter busanensis]KAA9327676.1 response regulator transcription factor [Hymenobacter busanensis]QHJ05984.1 response regulator [Hymenobacter busanensis]
MPTVLLIEDEAALGMIVKDSLEVRGFTVQYAADGEEGLRLFRQHCPDIVVADVMMPKLDGFSLAEQIRRENPVLPILFLTARSQPADVVRGFELGGNDYLKKPFSMDELIVRIKAQLNRFTPPAAPAPSGPLRIGRYQFDHPKQKLLFEGQAEELTHREAELLKHLYDQRNQVLARGAVLQALWGDDNFFNGRSLDVFITRLRRYLRHDPQVQIMNVRGIGYKLIA